MKTRFVYMTASDREEAARIGTALVERRLAACANILDGMESIYWWEGEVQRAREAVLIAKTIEDRVEELIACVRDLHSYDTPAIVVLPVEEGHPDFLAWIEKETRPA